MRIKQIADKLVSWIVWDISRGRAPAKSGLTGREAAEKILEVAGLGDVTVRETRLPGFFYVPAYRCVIETDVPWRARLHAHAPGPRKALVRFALGGFSFCGLCALAERVPVLWVLCAVLAVLAYGALLAFCIIHVTGEYAAARKGEKACLLSGVLTKREIRDAHETLYGQAAMDAVTTLGLIVIAALIALIVHKAGPGAFA